MSAYESDPFLQGCELELGREAGEDLHLSVGGNVSKGIENVADFRGGELLWLIVRAIDAPGLCKPRIKKEG